MSIAVNTDDDGSGVGLVTVDEAVVAELRFAEGSAAWETADFSALGPAQAQAVAASIVQVWHEDAVIEAALIGAARGVGSWERRSLGPEQGSLPPSSRSGSSTNRSPSGTRAAEPPTRRA
ncbi:hypothetical protein [Nannocystis bainbridge]|uniref:Uncharacterized protein n=1 Tax=Nannocystis bainbridge TaxID=2995303 RepID=A0ABT5DSM9_9BACT|nr:hypothetical protein [Nannocystis bainbridge]MDC0716625.1 hypothetical protein [Nannocystis bainbridge]